jgi:hypothetical protein
MVPVPAVTARRSPDDSRTQKDVGELEASASVNKTCAAWRTPTVWKPAKPKEF